MSWRAVLAANNLAEYIINKEHYGIECNICTAYRDYMKDHFLAECNPELVCNKLYNSNDTFTLVNGIPTVTSDTTIDCSQVNIDEIIEIANCTGINIIDCDEGTYKRSFYSPLLENSFYNDIIGEDPAKSVGITLDSFVVDGIEQIDNSPANLYIDTDNIQTTTIGGVTYVTNIISWLNSLNIDKLTFEAGVLTIAGITYNGMYVTYPENTTWEIETSSNNIGTEESVGVNLDQDGLIALETKQGLGYTPEGSLISAYDVYIRNANNTTIITEC
jgi:hypothetical protein